MELGIAHYNRRMSTHDTGDKDWFKMGVHFVFGFILGLLLPMAISRGAWDLSGRALLLVSLASGVALGLISAYFRDSLWRV